MNLLKRLKFAWRAFKGEAYKCGDNQYIFPERIVQLLAWRDTIIALDSQGRIYEMRADYSGFMTTQLISENPTGAYQYNYGFVNERGQN